MYKLLILLLFKCMILLLNSKAKCVLVRLKTLVLASNYVHSLFTFCSFSENLSRVNLQKFFWGDESVSNDAELQCLCPIT